MTYYIWPFPASITIGQHFRDLPNNGVNPAGGHTGDDFPCSEGTPVRAPGNGRVVKAGTFALMNGADNQWWYTPMGGNTIVLDCGDTEPTFGFSHLSSFAVNEGDWVAQGQVIGYTGNTGTSTGPHCHFEAIPPGYDLHSDTYGRVDPATYCTGYFDGSAAIAAQGTITTQEDPLVPNESDKVFWPIEGSEKVSLNELLNSIDRKASAALAAIGGMLAVQLPDPSEPGKTYSVADFIVWSATNAKVAAGSAAVAASNTDPAALGKAVAAAAGAITAEDVAAQLVVTVKPK